ncbi:sensor histidine kinase [Pseudoalteromonas ulvae]|uniref:sensor histidine kinase n=1 Tax=Pseudoalteromonas ulvae TaxID=107327 RepID=UPI00186BAEC3|nr:ATP-binding protein [Pseudoalteromonas ulvae]
MSLRAHLIMVLLASIVLVCFGAAIAGYKSSMQQADELFDQELVSLARAMNPLVGSVHGPMLEQASVQFNNYAIQIWVNEKLMLNLVPASQHKKPIVAFKAGFAHSNFAGQRWRTFSHHQDNAWILVAQPQRYRFELAENMTLAAVTPLILSMPLLALMISILVKHSLNPLIRLADKLQTKQADDFSAVTLSRDSFELRPVVETLNRLLERVQGAFLREKHFASDAAHELRTPLSILKISMHNLMSEQGDPKENLQALEQGVQRMSHVVEQMMLLNRTHPEQFKNQFQLIALKGVIQDAVESLYNQVLEKNHDLSFEGDDVVLPVDQFTIMTLLQNLIGNAIKYTPDNGQIHISLKQTTQRVTLKIEDSGPGIPTEERTRIFDRFYRVGGDGHHSNVIGCGLGLAIVKHIITLYHAQITLDESDLGGLAITVCFKNSQLVEEVKGD